MNNFSISTESWTRGLVSIKMSIKCKLKKEEN